MVWHIIFLTSRSTCSQYWCKEPLENGYNPIIQMFTNAAPISRSQCLRRSTIVKIPISADFGIMFDTSMLFIFFHGCWLIVSWEIKLMHQPRSLIVHSASLHSYASVQVNPLLVCGSSTSDFGDPLLKSYAILRPTTTPSWKVVGRFLMLKWKYVVVKSMA